VSALPSDDYAAPTRSSEHDFQFEVTCECGHSNCTGLLVMSVREYEAVRQHPTRFLIKEGHEVPDVVRVVSYGTGYVVVEKLEADAFSVGGHS
jgi:hypothetical protein